MAARHWDAGIENITTLKVNQSFSFNSTFDSAPQCIANNESPTAAKGHGCSSITTTGGDIYSEVADEAMWVAREVGYDDGAAAAASKRYYIIT